MVNTLAFDGEPDYDAIYTESQKGQPERDRKRRAEQREERARLREQGGGSKGGCCMTVDELQLVLGEHYTTRCNLTNINKARVLLTLKNLGHSLEELAQKKSLPDATVQQLVVQFS